MPETELPSETEVTRTWGRHQCCKVSIICTTFNHEKYISTALDGFLSQRTNFPFEIIVHDDASADGTRSIVAAYAKRYPRLVKPIFQTENQYSKGGFKPAFFAMKLATGSFFAICEGDDYWIDRNKLQMQIDALETHPGQDFCCHSALRSFNELCQSEPDWSYGQRTIFTVRDILRCPTGTFAPTSSYILRKSILDQIPDWFYEKAPVGDFFMEMYGARRGGALYINRPMSVYRAFTESSWHVTTYGNQQRFNKHVRGMMEALTLMEPDFGGEADSFRWKRAWLTTFYAQNYLLTGNHQAFSKAIERSVESYRYISTKQWVFFRLRKAPYMARAILLLKRRKHRRN
jgi:glycosyltransferase involved in cell wall biosynthesis